MFPEFEHLYTAQFKKRAARLKTIKAEVRARQRNGEYVAPSLDPEEIDDDEHEPVPFNHHHNHAAADDFDDIGGGGFDHDDDDVCWVRQYCIFRKLMVCSLGICRHAGPRASRAYW